MAVCFFFHSYILQKTPLKLVNWFVRYEQMKDAKNNRKQKTFSALFGSILKSIFPTSDFCLITSQIDYSGIFFLNFCQYLHIGVGIFSFGGDVFWSLTGGNWQKWKRVFLTCHCHKIYRDEAVGLKSCKNTWKITIFVKMWNLEQYRENLIFCQ